MQRLVCVVEGKGDVQAIPRLCARILASIGASRWYVDESPIRRPRSQLVDERMDSPARPCRVDSLRKAYAIAEARKPNAVLFVCDSDDDCPSVWASSVMETLGRDQPSAAVMAVREFECWLLWSCDQATLTKIRASNPERIRNAKGKLEQLIPGYAPTTHQLELTRQMDLARVRKHSRSFDKLVRTLGALCRIPVPTRPGRS